MPFFRLIHVPPVPNDQRDKHAPRRHGAAIRNGKARNAGRVKQRQFLKREAKRLGISIAELVRRIIDSHIEAR